MTWKSYMPSNGEESEMFFARFCYECVHEETPCEIQGLALCGEQPVEWVRRLDSGFPGDAKCTAFVKVVR